MDKFFFQRIWWFPRACRVNAKCRYLEARFWRKQQRSADRRMIMRIARMPYKLPIMTMSKAGDPMVWSDDE